MASTSSSFECEEEVEDEEEQQPEPEVANTTPAEKETSTSDKEEISAIAKPESSGKQSKLGPSMPAEILAKYYEDPLLDDDDEELDAKEPKRQRVRPRHNKVRK